MKNRDAIDAFNQGKVIAYPTEAVFGLGCDPENEQAVMDLLEIKQRPIEKGLILLASRFEHLKPFINTDLFSEQQLDEILARWPDGITQVLPAREKAQPFITGKFSSIAVRLTTQPDVDDLCRQTGKPIVSTSANLSGEEPCRTWQQVEEALGDKVGFVIKGKTLNFTKPSQIIDGITGEVFRT